MIVKLIKNVITFCKLKKYHIDSGGVNYIGIDVKVVNRGKILLGNKVIIRPSTGLYTNPGVILKIGDNVEIGNHSTIAAHHEVVIENDVLTGPHVFIADYNHAYSNVNLPIWKQGEFAPSDSKVVIGEGTWLGTNVVVVGNVRIGKHCVVGANSVVNKDIPDYSVAVGMPCRVIKRYDFETKEWIRV